MGLNPVFILLNPSTISSCFLIMNSACSVVVASHILLWKSWLIVCSSIRKQSISNVRKATFIKYNTRIISKFSICESFVSKNAGRIFTPTVMIPARMVIRFCVGRVMVSRSSIDFSTRFPIIPGRIKGSTALKAVRDIVAKLFTFIKNVEVPKVTDVNTARQIAQTEGTTHQME